MQRRFVLMGGAAAALAPLARAHHGWSSFDAERPIYLEGRAEKVSWRNPHVELVLALPAALAVPADLARRALPPQSAPVDGPAIVAKAVAPQRADKRWAIELAPLTRMQAWKVPELQAGAELALVGYTFAGEKGEAVCRCEYLFVGTQVYGLRSSPA